MHGKTSIYCMAVIHFLISGAFATLVPSSREWPGTYGTASGFDEKIYRYWLPDTAKAIRGIYLDEKYDSLGHDATCPLGTLRYAFIQYSGDPARNYGSSVYKAPTAAQILDFIAAVAQKTGHPELVNSPMIWNGQFSNSWISSSFPGRVVCQRRWGGGGDGPMFECREESSYGKPSVTFTARNEYTWSVMWGWTHGWYSGRDLWWPWVTEIVRLRVPASWNPLSGKPQLKNIPQDSVWLGDPSTVNNDFPTIASYAQYQGNKSAAVWLPNGSFAHVWRAYSSRHPTETMGQQGEGAAGSVASNYGLSGQPNFMVTSPSRPYNLHKTGGNNYPVVSADTQLVIKASEFGVARIGPKITKIEFFDSELKLAEMQKNAYNLYSTPRVSLRKNSGAHSIYAIVTLEGGRRLTSRPAMLYVTDSRKASTLGDNDRSLLGSSKQTLSIAQLPEIYLDLQGRLLARDIYSVNGTDLLNKKLGAGAYLIGYRTGRTNYSRYPTIGSRSAIQ